jgi:hypothetical protein
MSVTESPVNASRFPRSGVRDGNLRNAFHSVTSRCNCRAAAKPAKKAARGQQNSIMGGNSPIPIFLFLLLCNLFSGALAVSSPEIT